VVLEDAEIGEDCNICSHCFIENDVHVGDRVTIKSGVQLWDGVRLGDDVFVGPNVTFTNDRSPRSKKHPDKFLQTHVQHGASIGANATILPGVSIGQHAMIGAGAVVTRSIPPNAVAVGNPARVTGYIGARPADYQDMGAGTSQPRTGATTTKVWGATIYSLPKFRDPRGSLTAGEFPKAIPFSVARYFMVFDVPSAEIRGEHAHRDCHQFLIAAHGSVSVVVDDGENREELVLNTPSIGLHLAPMTWGIQYKYSSDAVLLVFASHRYDPDDYIRDYSEFQELLRSRP
jgi:serine acetyltransferase